ncbi:MAG TPA: hypothetical protein VG498_08115 [Terriglobales bacterium]|nr:hypothetical protein [Terriglobales bacterium]
MLVLALFYVAVGLAALFAWHLYFARKSRKRAFEVLAWIEDLICGHGHVTTIQWQGASTIHVPIKLRSNAFHNASLNVNLIPRELPHKWVIARLKKLQETLIFQADLDWAPPFSLELQSYRLFARTRKDLPPDAPGWDFEQTTPFILTTRKDWQREITSVITSLLSHPDRQFLSIAFNQVSPHFKATMALDAIAPSAAARAELFDSLRELAAGASAPQI